MFCVSKVLYESNLSSNRSIYCDKKDLHRANIVFFVILFVVTYIHGNVSKDCARDMIQRLFVFCSLVYVLMWCILC